MHEDSFIAQTLGIKDYCFRNNTIARYAKLSERLARPYPAGKSQVLMARLIVAD